MGFEGMWPGTCDWVFVPKGDMVQIKRKKTAEKKHWKVSSCMLMLVHEISSNSML